MTVGKITQLTEGDEGQKVLGPRFSGNQLMIDPVDWREINHKLSAATELIGKLKICLKEISEPVEFKTFWKALEGQYIAMQDKATEALALVEDWRMNDKIKS